MIRHSTLPVTVIAIVVATVLAVSVSGAQEMILPLDKVDSQTILDRFIDSIRKHATLDDAAKQAILASIEEAKTQEGTETQLINIALRKMYPDYAIAQSVLGDERTKQAIAAFEMLGKSKDEFLSAHAGYFQARAHILDENFDKALPFLQAITVGTSRGKTLYHDDALFLEGICQANTLNRMEAINTLKTFLLSAPNAPERMQVGARHMIGELGAIADGSIHDAQDRMEYSHRRLKLANSGKNTQDEQGKIISILETLIKEAEEKEKQQGQGQGQGQGGQGQGQGQSQGPPSSNAKHPSNPANQSTAPGGTPGMGALHRVSRGKASDAWGSLPPKQRDKILNSLKAKFPDRYKDLIEQYYKSFQNDRDD